MNGPDEITSAFDEYVAAFKAGEGDPTPYLERFSGDDRRELEVLVDAFLETGPRADVDLLGVRDSQIEAVVEKVVERLGAPSGGLSALVLALRRKRSLKSSDVVAELAAAYEASPAERDKIDAYYHDLEWGTLPASGISESLLGSLATILGTKAGRLREAGRELRPPGSQATGLLFARLADDAEFELEASASMELPAPSGAARRSDPPDRIDELFTGG